MLLSNRRRFLGLLAALPLAACGFAPAYGPSGGADRLTDRVAVETTGTRGAYYVTRQIESRLGRAKAPAYRLSYDLSINEDVKAVTPDNIIRRYNLTGKAKYRLVDLNGAELLTGTVENFSGFSTSDSTVATRAARKDAEERLSIMLADQIVTRLIAAAPGLPG